MDNIITWEQFFCDEQKQAYYQKVLNFVSSERAAGKVVYPAESMVLKAFELTPLHKVKVVIIGQDPYHGEAQAHGLSFSVPKDIPIPPSLLNIYKELKIEYPHFVMPEHGCLHSWAQQGVLLLNSVLTVEAGRAHSHAKCGWETLTDHAVIYLDQQLDGLVFMLWGAHAQKKGQSIDQAKHLVLKAPHPSPLSVYRGFWGCGHFTQANQWLSRVGKTEIDWLPVL